MQYHQMTMTFIYIRFKINLILRGSRFWYIEIRPKNSHVNNNNNADKINNRLSTVSYYDLSLEY